MVVRISRRSFLLGGLCLGIVPRTLIAEEDIEFEGNVPYLPDADAAEYVAFSRLDDLSVDDEPIIIAFYGFGFADEEAATENFSIVNDFFYEEMLAIIDPGERAEKVGIGRVGDQRAAYLRDGDNPLLTSIVRIGPSILASTAWAFGGDIPRYMAELYKDVLPDDIEASASPAPDLLDMPKEWDESTRQDILELVHDQGR